MADLLDTDTEAETETAEARSAALPFALPLELTVHDRDTIAELAVHPEGEQRDGFALDALRIGVLALKQARGQIDADLVRRESDRMIQDLDRRLGEHANVVHERLTNSLKDYFDPQNGRFQERIERLIQKDGELEKLMGRQIGTEDSELLKTLSSHFGDESPLMKILSPDQSQGLLGALRETLDEQLQTQREHVLEQFSLDNKEGALSRFIGELTERQGELSKELQGRIDQVVQQFSLDDDDSALSRLVRNVEQAQRKITREFSLDEDASALSRLKKMLEETNQSINSQLSLDEEDSALARLKRELLSLLKEQRESSLQFQEEVKGTLQSMVVRKQEAERSTRHGLEFEDAVFEFLQHESNRVGDIATATGATVGKIKNCKVGDCVVQLGPETAAPGANVVIEAKEKVDYNVTNAREEIETARKNRAAQIGLFVFSKRTAPDGIEPLTRYGHDVIVVWDAEDSTTDVYLRVGLTLARALCVRIHDHDKSESADFTAIDKAILEIEKKANSLDDIETWAKTIQSNSEKILNKVRITRKSLLRQAEILQKKTHGLKEALSLDCDEP